MTKNNLTNDLRKLQSTLKSKKPIQLDNNQLKSCLIAEKLAKNAANGEIIINSEVQKIVMVKPTPIKKNKNCGFPEK